MPELLLLDRWTLAFRLSQNYPPDENTAAARGLDRPTLWRTVLAAIRTVLRAEPSLRRVRVTVNTNDRLGG